MVRLRNLTAAWDTTSGDGESKFYLAIYRIGNLLYKEVSLAPIPGQYNYVIPVASMYGAWV